MRNLPCVVSGSIGREKRVPEEGKHVRLGGTWSTEEPEAAPMPRAWCRLRPEVKGLKYTGARSRDALWTPVKSTRGI